MGEQTQVLTVEETAERLRVGPRLVYNLVARGELKAIRVGRFIRIPADNLEAYLHGEGGSSGHGQRGQAKP